MPYMKTHRKQIENGLLLFVLICSFSYSRIRINGRQRVNQHLSFVKKFLKWIYFVKKTHLILNNFVSSLRCNYTSKFKQKIDQRMIIYELTHDFCIQCFQLSNSYIFLLRHSLVRVDRKEKKRENLLNFYVCPITIDIMQFLTTLGTNRTNKMEFFPGKSRRKKNPNWIFKTPVHLGC